MHDRIRKLAAPLLLLSLGLVGCIHHQVAFNEQDTSWHYAIEGASLSVPVVAVVPSATQQAQVEISSVTAGAANRWHAQYGRMFVQALDVELSQLFSTHRIVSVPEPGGSYELALDVPTYSYSGFKARATVSARVRDPSGQEILNQEYSAVGGSDAGKVVGLGAFGMRSAVRQSTLEAYRSVFDRLRVDLRKVIAAEAAASR